MSSVLGSYLQKRRCFGLLPSHDARFSERPILEPSVRPMQDNADDCGVFMCLYAQVRCRTVDGFVDTLHMDASDVKYFRRELRQALLSALY